MSDIYSAPQSELDEEELGELELASRWNRFFAAMVDGILAMLFTIPVMMAFGVWDLAMKGQTPSMVVNLALGVAGMVFYVLVHGYFLSKNGQTIGKKCLGIRIVGIDNQPVSLGHILSKRYVPLAVASLVPVVGPYIASIEALFIFRKDKRCVHDLIAGTKVVKV